MFNRIAKLLSFTRVIRNEANVSDVKIDLGGKDNITAEHFSDPGDDSFPLSDDYVLAVDVPRSGGKVAAGYVDPVNTPKALEGDKRIYGRDKDSGVSVNEAWLKNDGSILVSNGNGSVLLKADGGSIATTPQSTFDCAADGSIKGDNGAGSFELELGGDFVVNGVSIDPTGNITTPATVNAANVAASASLTVASKEMGGHTHTQGNDTGGDSQVNTGVPV